MVCRLFAEGAVRLPSGRFTPYAAQSRFESACGDNLSVLNSLPLLRALRACISGMPPVVFGLGSWMVAGVSAMTALASRSRTMAFLIKDTVIRILHLAAGISRRATVRARSAPDIASGRGYGPSAHDRAPGAPRRAEGPGPDGPKRKA